MGCGSSGKVVPVIELVREKQKMVVVVIGTSDSKQMIDQCLKSLKEECAQYLVKQYMSSDVAFDYIRQLGENISVILIIAGHSDKKLKDEMARSVPLPPNIRNLFVYSSENENTEKPTTPFTQYVYGKRHLLSAIHDALVAFDVDASAVRGHLTHYASITVHQSALNEMFEAIKSIQFEYLKFTIKISRMKVVLSPSNFQFIAYAEVSAHRKLSIKQDVHGECELIMDENTKKFVIRVIKLIIKLPKNPVCGSSQDVGKWLPTFPLDGFINFARTRDLPDKCEAKCLSITPRHPIISVEEQRVTVSVQIHCAETTKALK